MGREINPGDEKYKGNGGDRVPDCKPGDKLLAAVGFERYNAKTGSRCLSLRFICVHDFDASGDEKAQVFENFVIEDSSMWRFVKFVEAIGHHEPFDVDDDEAIGAILTSGYVRARLKAETFGGKTRVRVDAFSPAGDQAEDPEWLEWISAGEENHAKYMEWRAKNPRGAGGDARSGGRSGGGRSGGGAGGTDDSSIPF